MLGKPELAPQELQTVEALHFLIEGGIIFRILAEDEEAAHLTLKEHLTAPDQTVSQRDPSAPVTVADSYFKAGAALFVQDITATYDSREYHIRQLIRSGPMERVAPVDSLKPISTGKNQVKQPTPQRHDENQFRLFESTRAFKQGEIHDVYHYLPDA